MSDGMKSPLPASESSSKKHGSNSPVTTHVSFPNSAKSSQALSINGPKRVEINPFKMPPDSDIFVMRDKQRQIKKLERDKQANLHVYEKMTYASHANRRSSSKMLHLIADETNVEEEDEIVAKDDPEFVIAVTRDRHVEKESLVDYINKKREMFLVQYSLGVKRDEMRKLEEIAQAEERKLELAEQYLEEDATMFDEFLKENDRNSVEAIKAAEAETKLKLEKVTEIKKINTQMMSIKSDISKYEDMLKEYQLYKRFLDNLTPNEWKNQDDMEITKKNEERQQKIKFDRLHTACKMKASLSPTNVMKKPLMKLRSKVSSSIMPKIHSRLDKDRQRDISSSPMETDSGTDEELGLTKIYFTEPSQLLDIFAELEEHNLSLIQNSQETEEALEEMKQGLKQTELKMDTETVILKTQIEKLNMQIEKEETRASALEMKSKLFSFGEFKADAQEKMLQELDAKVEEVYRGCIGDNEASISTLQMLTNIENRLEELFETIEMMPADKVEAAEKAKEKDRRLKLREEKLEQQRVHQEERVKRALERAKAEPKKKTGKKLVFRSEPPRLKKKQDKGADLASREEEELALYFQW